MKISKQKSSDKLWTDESGQAIPYERVTRYERAAEHSTNKMAVQALKINEELRKYKENVMAEVQRLYELFEAENGQIGKGKGGATFYNFDRSIKVSAKVQESITFDENTIELARQKLMELLNEGMEGAKDFIKPIVMDAFQKTNGTLDTKRVLSLRRHTAKVKNRKYSEAMELIDKAIRRPSSKKYFQIFLRDDQGEYQDINLNFSYL